MQSYQYKSSELESSLASFAQRGITEFTLQDEAILSHKGKLLHFLQIFAQKAGDVFLTLPVNAANLKKAIASDVINYVEEVLREFE